MTVTTLLTVNPTSTTASAAATFQGLDTTTQGNWKNVYNYPNVTIIGGGAVNPSTTPVPVGANYLLWASSTSSTSALQNLHGSGRVAARWSAPSSFYVDINFTDQSTHQIAIYCLDWNQTGRAETISVLDATTNNVLDTRSVSNFANGVYALWNVTGHVRLQVTRTAGNNAVISGIFLK